MHVSLGVGRPQRQAPREQYFSRPYLPVLRDSLLHHIAQLARGVDRGVPDHEGHTARIGTQVDRREIGVPAQYAHVVERHAQLLRCDVRHHGVATLADLAGSAEYGDASGTVDLHLHAGLRHLVGVDRVVSTGDVGRPGDSEAVTEGQFAKAFLPSTRPLHGLETLHEAVRGHPQLVDRARVGADEVAPTKLDRVEADPLGQLVDLYLEGEAGLNRTMPALGAARWFVGVHAGRIEAVCRHLVGRAQQLARVVRRDQPEGGVGASVQEGLRVDRRQPTVRGRAGPVLHIEGVSSAVRVEDLLACVQDLDRSARDHGELRHAELEVERLALAAEGSAHQRLKHTHVRLVDAEDTSQLSVQIVRNLGRGPHRELARGLTTGPLEATSRLPQPDRAMRFDGGVGRALEEVLALDDDVGGVHRLVDLAELQVHLLGDVAVPALFFRRMHIGRRTVRFERLVGIEERRKHFVLDVDEPEGADRGVLVDRGHRRDPVPDVPDSVHAERVFIRRPRDDAVRGRHISPRYHAVHSVQRFGGVSVDRYDAGVWVRAAENLAVQHAGKHQIVGVERSTRRLVEPLDFPHGRAD